jgi:hypothetical protein
MQVNKGWRGTMKWVEFLRKTNILLQITDENMLKGTLGNPDDV